MLYQLNNYLLSQRLTNNPIIATPTAVCKPESSPATKPALQSPALNGPPDHVAFVIHGIGQQTEKFGFFQKHLQSLYDTTNKAVKENVPEKEINVQYVPIEWHKHIHEETDSMMDDITLRSIPTMRMVNNDYLSDAFFYLSKDRGQSIVNHVTYTFNNAYNQFMTENPGFNGKVAILAYSLGGIITWDILSNQHNKKKNKLYSKLDMTFPKLDFKPDYLFTLGSPLSAFLTVRNQDPKLYHPHSSIIFENIFHPFDPLAYRFEPLLESNYKNEPAVLVDRCSPPQQETASTIWSRGCEIINMLSQQQQRVTSLLSASGSNYCKEEKKKEEKVKTVLRPGSTLLFKGGNNVLSALKNYFMNSNNTSSNLDDNNYLQQQQQQEQRKDEEEMIDSNTSTPKLSLDCGSEMEEDEDYFLVQDEEEQVDTNKKPPYMYIAHTDMTTTSTCKRRHSSFVTATNDHFKKGENNEIRVCKRRKSSSDTQLLDTTITKGSSCTINFTTKSHNSLPHRIDYILQPEKFFGCFSKNEYFSGLTAHFSYWTHKDLMWHIVRRLENNNNDTTL